MFWQLWILLAAIAALVAGVVLVWRPLRAAWRESRLAEACRQFHQQRERLEAKFIQLRSIRRGSDASRWSDCEFDDDVAYARNRSNGELSAFVAVTVETRDLGSPESGPPDAVGNLRAVTAVFRFDGEHWETDGQAIFNLTPTEAIHFYQRELEMVGQEVVQRP
jgi:hypothetical protein